LLNVHYRSIHTHTHTHTHTVADLGFCEKGPSKRGLPSFTSLPFLLYSFVLPSPYIPMPYPLSFPIHPSPSTVLPSTIFPDSFTPIHAPNPAREYEERPGRRVGKAKTATTFCYILSLGNASGVFCRQECQSLPKSASTHTQRVKSLLALYLTLTSVVNSGSVNVLFACHHAAGEE